MPITMASSFLPSPPPESFAAPRVPRGVRAEKTLRSSALQRKPKSRFPCLSALPSESDRRQSPDRNDQGSLPLHRAASRRTHHPGTPGIEVPTEPFHLQRSFKAVLGISPRAYADSCRMNQLKRNLQAGHSVTRAMYDAGYSSSSRLYERTASQLGMTPRISPRSHCRSHSLYPNRFSAGPHADCSNRKRCLCHSVRRF